MKVVIVGSVKLQTEINQWVYYWNNQDNHFVLNYPKVIAPDNFESLYSSMYKNFFNDIKQADILFVANNKKNDVDGYIGAETFAELSFGLVQKIVYGQNIKLILAYLPTKEVACYEEIILWRN